MQTVIDTYFNCAADARAWHLMLRYKWVINSYETLDADITYGFDVMKEREGR